MTLIEAAVFILICFVLVLAGARLLSVLWGAIVYQQDRMDYGRNYWDEDEVKAEITSETLEAMGARITPIEILPAGERYE